MTVMRFANRSLTCGPLALAQFDSLRLDPKLLDDWPPFLRIGLLQSGEGFRRLLFAGEYLQPEFDQPRLYCRIDEGIHGRRIELTDDIV